MQRPAPAGEDERLLALQQQSTELGRVALLGSRVNKPQPPASPPALLRRLEKLKQQKLALEIKLKAGDISVEDFPEENLTEEFLIEGIAALQKEIEVLKAGYHNKSLVLRRIQLYDAIDNKLLEHSRESQLIHETMAHNMDLCHHILKSQKAAITLDEKLIDVRKKRMKLKETCTEVMAALKAMKEQNNFAQVDNPSFKKINAFIAKEIDVVTVIQNAFQ
ncbi:centromere protein H isoform X2 [Eleutherodactylus coqui]